MNKVQFIQGVFIALMRVTITQALIMTILTSLVSAANLKGQDVLDRKVSIDVNDKKIKAVLMEIEDQASVIFTYKSASIPASKKVTLKLNETALSEVLKQLFGSEIVPVVIKDEIVLKPATPTEAREVYEGPEITITGTVTTAEDGSAMPGVSIALKGTTQGTVTDSDGKYTLQVPDENAVLVFTFIGYAPQEIIVGQQTVISPVMNPDITQLGEVVVVGYGTQKKESLTAAVSVVDNQDLVTTKNENLQNMLTGKIPGLRVRQNTSEPGQFNASIDIRGFGAPLVVVDGIPRTNMARIDPEDIESISVVKDASAAVFGSRSANGVILITTKKGSKTGEPSITYSGTVTWQKLSNFPDLVGAADWMTLYNERYDRHNVANANKPNTYPADTIEAYRNGTKQGTNWKDLVLRRTAPQTQHNISATGGNDKITYFASVGYQYQGSFLKTDAINYEKYNFRSNLSAKVSKNITFDLNLAGLSDKRESSPYGSSDIIRSMWIHRPTDKVWYNEEAKQYSWMSWNSLVNPVAMMDKELAGENSYQSKWFQSSASLTYDVPKVEGLSLKGTYSYDHTINDDKEYVKTFRTYRDNGDVQISNSYAKGNSRTSRFYYAKNASLWRLQVAFERTFGNHFVSVMNLLENSHYQGDNFNARRYGVLPLSQIFAGISDNQEAGQSTNIASLYDYANRASVGRATYDFKGKYLAEFSYRYEGSSRFPSGKRWGFFPAVSAGWRLSAEPFWEDNESLNFINNLKIRGSYGITGDDSGLTYQFVTGYQYPASGGSRQGLPAGYIFGTSFTPASASTGLANQAITWYEAKTTNIGLDADAWSGLIGATIEFFKRDRTGLLATRAESLPGIVGAVLPQENLNSDRIRGFEVELRHTNRIGDISYQVSGNISYTTTRTKYAERARAGNSYDNWRNNTNSRNNNVWWGWEGDGRVTNWDDIYYNPVYGGSAFYTARTMVPGDYKYEDWNGDGIIDDLDKHPIAYNGQVPLINYGITLSAQWKGVDLTMLWQGAGKKYVIAREFMREPLWSSSNSITNFMDRWHPVDPTADPYNPATEWVSGEYGYTGTLSHQESDFNLQNAAYIRLKSLELGYTVPKNILSRISLKSIRIYANAYNLLTFTKLKYMDPEFFTTNDTSRGGLSDLGYMYPINKSYSLGITAKF